MSDEKARLRDVEEQAATDGDVIGAVERALDETMDELDVDLAESERELAEADALYAEAEGRSLRRRESRSC